MVMLNSWKLLIFSSFQHWRGGSHRNKPEEIYSPLEKRWDARKKGAKTLGQSNMSTFSVYGELGYTMLGQWGEQKNLKLPGENCTAE